MLDQFLNKEILSDNQSKPPLDQIQTIYSHLLSCHIRDQHPSSYSLLSDKTDEIFLQVSSTSLAGHICFDVDQEPRAFLDLGTHLVDVQLAATSTPKSFPAKQHSRH